MNTLLNDCTLCPRDCHVDRMAGQTGYCGQTDEIMAARAALHMWEEPCISGQAGSGAVFFSGCSLGCVYCQNDKIAHGRTGRIISPKRLSEIFLELQSQHASNINLVTPTHFVPQIADALRQAKNSGLFLPVVYNTGGYEKVETLRLLDGLVDVYLPDLKYVSPELGEKYSFAENYFDYASRAIEEMLRQVGEPRFADPEEFGGRTAVEDSREDDYSGPLMKKGVIVRHLALPGCAGDSRRVLRYLHDTYGNRLYISLMSQYTPLPHIAAACPELNRKLRAREYDALVDYALSIGIENGFIQEGEAALESFIPPFDCTGV